MCSHCDSEVRPLTCINYISIHIVPRYSTSLWLLAHGYTFICTAEQVSPSQFEAHAGWAARRQP